MMDNFIWDHNGGPIRPNLGGEGRAGKKVCLLFSAGLPVDMLC